MAEKDNKLPVQRLIAQASIVGIIGNLFLSATKISVGILAGSLSVVGDGIDSLADVLASVITYLTSKIIHRPPDSTFAYGYLKADTIATKALSIFILFGGLQLGIETVRKLFEPGEVVLPDTFAIAVTILSIVGKLALAYYHYKVGRKTQSSMLRATAANMRNDVLISLSVLAGLIFTYAFQWPYLDSIMALLVSAWILRVGYKIFMESNIDLMDGLNDQAVYKKIFNAIEDVEGVYNPHRVRVRKIGHKLMINVDIEINGMVNLTQAHSMAHQVEQNVKNSIENVFDVSTHIEPLGDKTQEKNIGLSWDKLFNQK
ncbi:MAG: cation transporter [Bacteroidales bacterium]|nr:cation transporter [Bacteroidales bacterium]